MISPTSNGQLMPRQRFFIIAVSSFVCIQWLLRLWIVPLLPKSTQEPRPISFYRDIASSNFIISRNILNEEKHSNEIKNSSKELVREEDFEAWKRMMDKRKQTLKKVCRKHGHDLRKFMNHKKLIFDTKHHIAYCRNAKAGTTTWLGEMLQEAGVPITGLNPEEIHTKALELFPILPPRQAAIEMQHQDRVLFTVVRHPLARLVSAYRDKIPEHYREDLQKQMIDNYRSSKGIQNRQLDDPSLPTFREFALFVSHQILSCPKIVNSACIEKVDPHWRPFYDRCAPCDVHYDVISKMETFSRDHKYIRKLAGLTPKLDSSGPLHAHTSKGISTVNLTQRYFSQLSSDERKQVYEAYLYDFLLFDYSPDMD